MKIDTVLLSLIRVHPNVTGYQLSTIIKESTGHISGIHLSKIYPALKRLTECGYLMFQSEPSRGRLDQKYYSITPEGEKAFKELLAAPFEFGPSRSTFDDFTLKLACMVDVDDAIIIKHLDQGIAHLESELDAAVARERESSETSFMTAIAGEQREEALKLWDHVRTQLRDETEARLAWLVALRKEYDR